MNKDDNENRRRNGQWREGQSGNPKGRPKKLQELSPSVMKVLMEPLTAISSDGKTAQLGGVEAPFLALCNKGLKGSDAALIKAFKIILEVIPAKDLYALPQRVENRLPLESASERINRALEEFARHNMSEKWLPTDAAKDED